MGMPRKGSRKVEVDGDTFLWRISGDSYSRRWHSGLSPVSLLLTCQRDEERPGRVLQASLISRNPPADDPDYAPGHRATLYPADVRQIIAHAVSKGWDPSGRGAAFELEPCDRQPEPPMYKIVKMHPTGADWSLR
jgi:hypothetical protein